MQRLLLQNMPHVRQSWLQLLLRLLPLMRPSPLQQPVQLP
jgi:hypothetical protein